MVRRDAEGHLTAIPTTRPSPSRHAARGRQAARRRRAGRGRGLSNYLELRADALLADDYRASDMAWMDMKDNTIDVVIGPIETYEDQLFGYKAANEAYVLVKDQEWSERLSPLRGAAARAAARTARAGAVQAGDARHPTPT